MNKIEQKMYSIVSGIPLDVVGIVAALDSDNHVKTAKECAYTAERISVGFVDFYINDRWKHDFTEQRTHTISELYGLYIQSL